MPFVRTTIFIPWAFFCWVQLRVYIDLTYEQLYRSKSDQEWYKFLALKIVVLKSIFPMVCLRCNYGCFCLKVNPLIAFLIPPSFQCMYECNALNFTTIRLVWQEKIRVLMWRISQYPVNFGPCFRARIMTVNFSRYQFVSGKSD